MEAYYDLHIHSCLSPCGEEEMTPGNICGMAQLAGLGIVALTDHNTAANARLFCRFAAEMGLIGIPGMELTTREEVHVVCLFPDPDCAEQFSAHVETRLQKEKNRPDIFGRQLLIDENDEPYAEYPWLLTNATNIGIYETAGLVESFGGLAFPAHLDRASFSLLSNLGLWDDEMGFALCEYHKPPENTHPIDTSQSDLFAQSVLPLGARRPLPYLTDSDAHRLESIQDGRFRLTVEQPCAIGVLRALREIASKYR